MKLEIITMLQSLIYLQKQQSIYYSSFVSFFLKILIKHMLRHEVSILYQTFFILTYTIQHLTLNIC